VEMIEQMDHNVGRLLQTLDALRLSKKTVVIFASDNGGTLSARNHPFSNIKGSTFEGGIRVPAIARWPGVIPEGVVSDQACITFDFTASIAKIAGVEASPDKPFEGIDILQHVAETREDFDRTFYWRKPRGETLWKAVRQGRLKYVGERHGDEYREFLFDLSSDPAESQDLKGDRPEDFGRLKNLYDFWEREVRRNRRGRPE
jgi:N-acetylgalactosamine-6-sulfatase